MKVSISYLSVLLDNRELDHYTTVTDDTAQQREQEAHHHIQVHEDQAGILRREGTAVYRPREGVQGVGRVVLFVGRHIDRSGGVDTEAGEDGVVVHREGGAESSGPNSHNDQGYQPGENAH